MSAELGKSTNRERLGVEDSSTADSRTAELQPLARYVPPKVEVLGAVDDLTLGAPKGALDGLVLPGQSGTSA
jgi:hypothetical protein